MVGDGSRVDDPGTLLILIRLRMLRCILRCNSTSIHQLGCTTWFTVRTLLQRTATAAHSVTSVLAQDSVQHLGTQWNAAQVKISYQHRRPASQLLRPPSLLRH